MNRIIAFLAVLLFSHQACAQGEDFGIFLSGVRAEAAGKGLSPQTLTALDGLQPIPHVIELDRRQAEFTMTLDQYLKAVVTPRKVKAGRKALEANRALLAAIEHRYGVPGRFVVALWGIESGFGTAQGGFPVLASLATLAWDGRRPAFFRGELLNALTMLDHGGLHADALVGSWAGAMGQCQFMPSTYLAHAVHWEGDGAADIWRNRADSLASIAHYLADLGWRDDQTWGRAVRLPPRFDTGLIGVETKKPLAEWAHLGVTAADGKTLPKKAGLEASVILVNGRAFAVYDNFRALMTWNRSTLFALSAGHLADALSRR